MMRNGLLLVVMAGLALLGCTSDDENPTWNPAEQYPPSVVDRPWYPAPLVEIEATEKVGNNIPIYYSRDPLVWIKHPQGQQPPQPPRTVLFYSSNGGTVWKRAGNFGLEQTHFQFQPTEDGRYWIRFVGPGQGTADVPPGQPHRVYVVDTHAPKINMTVSPSPWLDKDRKIPRQYHVGQEVVLHWTVDDKHLIKDSIQLATCYAQFPHNLVWSEFGEKMGPVGAVRVMIPPEAAHQAGLRFRIIANDKAGNIGIALSEILPVTAEPLPPGERPMMAGLAPANRQAPTPLETATPMTEPAPVPRITKRPAPAPAPVAPKQPAPAPIAQQNSPKRAASPRTDAAPAVQREDRSDIERRLAELKRQRDAQDTSATPLPEPAKLQTPTAEPAIANAPAPRPDKAAALQRSARQKPVSAATPAPLTDPIQIRPADKAPDIAPPSHILDPVVLEDTPKARPSTRRVDALPPVKLQPAPKPPVLKAPAELSMSAPKAASRQASKKDALPELSPQAATPAPKAEPAIQQAPKLQARPATPPVDPEPVVKAPTVPTQMPNAEPAETRSEIEARLAAARQRYEQQQRTENIRTPEPAASPPVVDIDDIADAVVVLPKPDKAAPPATRAAGEDFDVEEIAARARQVQPAEPARKLAPTPATQGPELAIEDIENDLAELKRLHDQKLATARDARIDTVPPKADAAPVVRTERPTRTVVDVTTAPKRATSQARADADDVNPLLKPIDVGAVDMPVEAGDEEPIMIAAASPRKDVMPGPMVRMDPDRPVTPAKAQPPAEESAEITFVDLPRPKSPTASAGRQGSARITSLKDVPESVQQGWPASGMTLQGGVNRLLNWLPQNTGNYTFVELQFSSDGGRKWVTVANGLREGRAAMWNVPKITAEDCRLRILGRDGEGGESVLAVSDPFKVDAGRWETVDITGAK